MSNYVCQKCGKKIIGTVHLNQQGTFHTLCAIPPSQPNKPSPSKGLKKLRRELDELDKDPSSEGSSVSKRTNIIPYEAAIDEILEDYIKQKNVNWWESRDVAKQAILNLLATARSDWAKEVLEKVDAIYPEVSISQGYSAEDVETIVGGNINRIKDEVRAIVREVK